MGSSNSAPKFADHLIRMVEDEDYAQSRKQQREKMKEVFEQLDENNNGSIESKEINGLFQVVIEGFQKAAEQVLDDDMPDHKQITSKEVCELFKQVDKEQDKKLSFNEFMVMVDELCAYLMEGKNIQKLGHIAASHKANN